MKQPPSSVAWVFMLLSLILTGCATIPPSPEKPKTLKMVKPAVTSQAAPTQTPSPKVLVTPSVSRAIPEKKEATKSTWHVAVLQNGVALENTDDKIPLKKAPFSIRLTLPTPQAVRFTAASAPPDLEASHLGKKLKALCTPVNLTPFCLDRATAYVDQNHDLSLKKLTHHYFFYRKNLDLAWMKVQITPQHTTLEWTIKTINNKPVANYKGTDIYMTLWVDSGNRLVFDRGELKQLALFFVN